MPRSGEQARLLLQQAALDLYRERGYDGTTTAEIADRAGVTERTYFRHFADKREVLFSGEAAVRADLERGLAGAPEDLDPLAALSHAFGAAFPLLRANRPFAEPRQAVIAATPALREREAAKEAGMTDLLAAGLRRRGLGEPQATLAARVGMAAFAQATSAWFVRPETDLAEHLRQAFEDLRALVVEQGADRTPGDAPADR